jgi:fructokinase
VVDTIGAGDSFTAAMTLGLLARWELDKINHHANEIAAYVASCAGATPALPPQLRAAPFGELVKQGKTTRD